MFPVVSWGPWCDVISIINSLMRGLGCRFKLARWAWRHPEVLVWCMILMVPQVTDQFEIRYSLPPYSLVCVPGTLPKGYEFVDTELALEAFFGRPEALRGDLCGRGLFFIDFE